MATYNTNKTIDTTSVAFMQIASAKRKEKEARERELEERNKANKRKELRENLDFIFAPIILAAMVYVLLCGTLLLV
jgi:hypothetical protein